MCKDLTARYLDHEIFSMLDRLGTPACTHSVEHINRSPTLIASCLSFFGLGSAQATEGRPLSRLGLPVCAAAAALTRGKQSARKLAVNAQRGSIPKADAWALPCEGLGHGTMGELLALSP